MMGPDLPRARAPVSLNPGGGATQEGTSAPSAGAQSITALPFAAPTITTPRLVLRPFAETDLEDVLDYQGREEVVRYLAWGPMDRAKAAAHLAKRIAECQLARAGDYLVFAVVVPIPGATGRVVGEIITILDSAEHAQVEIGWIFNPEFGGRGFATEAAQAVLDFCFNRLGAHRVFASLNEANRASAQVALRLGMRKEASFHQNRIFEGKWANSAIYALLAGDVQVERGSSHR